MYREEVQSTLVSFSCGASTCIELEFIDFFFFFAGGKKTRFHRGKHQNKVKTNNNSTNTRLNKNLNNSSLPLRQVALMFLLSLGQS